MIPCFKWSHRQYTLIDMQEHFNFPLHISFCQQWFLATASNCYLIKWSTIGPKKRVQIAHWSPSYPRSVGLIKSYSCRLVEGWMPASDATRLPASSDLSRPADLSSRTVLLLLLRCLFACTIASALMSAGSQAMALHGCWRLCASNSWSRWRATTYPSEIKNRNGCVGDMQHTTPWPRTG